MSYLIESEHYGRKETQPDLERFARDLAPLIGGRFEKTDSAWGAFIAIEGATVSVGKPAGSYRHCERVVLSIEATGIAHNDRPYYGRDDTKLPSITVSATRPIEAVAKEVKRRLIEPAQAPLAKRREYAANRVAERDKLTETVTQLRALYGEKAVSTKNGDGFTAHLWISEPYVAANVSADGRVSIERVQTVTLEKFNAIVALLRSVP